MLRVLRHFASANLISLPITPCQICTNPRHLLAGVSLFYRFVVDRLPGRPSFQDVDVKDRVIIRRHGRLEHVEIRLEECVTRTGRLECRPLPTPLS